MKKLFLSFMVSLAFCVAPLLAQSGDFELIWADEFDYTGLPDSTKWNYNVGGHGWGNNELQFYTNKRLENARVEDGKLTITAIREPYKGMEYTSTRLVTEGKGDWLYGRMEIRAKLPKGRGTWPAIWTLPTDWAYGAWPESGEMDIMEHVGYDPDRVHFSIHCLDYFFKIGTQKSSQINLLRTDSLFYTYALEWTPDYIQGYVDDSLYYRFENERLGWRKWPFDKPFHLILNIAVGGGWGGAHGIDTTIWPQQMEVDFVRVYKFNAETDAQAPSVPTDLEARINPERIALFWEPAYDNYSVKEYRVSANGNLLGTTRVHSFDAKNLKPETAYNFEVVAADWAGNLSEPLKAQFKTSKLTAINIPGRVEAEDYIAELGTKLEKTADTLGGYNVNWIEPGDMLEYAINVTKAGKFKLALRAATERKDAVAELYAADSKLLTTVAIGNTHSWQKWQNFQSNEFSLPKGKQNLKLKFIGDRSNLNWLEIK